MRAEFFPELGGREKMLVVAVATVGEGAAADDAFHERVDAVLGGGFAGELILAGEADEFGHLGVAVFTVEFVAALFQRTEDRVVVEDGSREGEVARVAGVGGEVGEDLVEAAELGFEDFLGLGVAEFFVDAGEVVGEAAFDLEGLAVAGDAVGVAQAGEDLVQGVVGDPLVVEGKSGGFDLAGAEVFVDAFGDRKDVAVAVGRLAGGEFGDDVVHALKRAGVAGGGVVECEGGEVVAERVAVDAAGLPAAVAFGLGGQAGLGAEAGEQAIGLHDLEQEAGVGLLGGEEGAVEQAHPVRREGFGDDANGWAGHGGVARDRGRSEGGQRQNDKNE